MIDSSMHIWCDVPSLMAFMPPKCQEVSDPCFGLRKVANMYMHIRVAKGRHILSPTLSCSSSALVDSDERSL